MSYSQVDRLQQYLADTGVSQTRLAKRFGISKTKLSLYLSRNYDIGTLPQLDANVKDFLDREEFREQQSKTRLFLQTTQAKQALQCLDVCLTFKSMRIIRGVTGIGKSWAFHQYQMEHPNVMIIECDPMFKTKRGIYTLLYRQVFKEPLSKKASLEDAYLRLIDKLKDADMLLVFDESQKLLFEALDSLRFFKEHTGVGMLFGDTLDEVDAPGAYREKQFERNPQLKRRCGDPLVLDPVISEADVAIFAGEYGVTNAKIIAWLTNVANLPTMRYAFVSDILHHCRLLAKGNVKLMNHKQTYLMMLNRMYPTYQQPGAGMLDDQEEAAAPVAVEQRPALLLKTANG